MKKPLLLMILDGFGVNPSDRGNAIHAANTPNYDHYLATYPHTQIGASGMDVGLPDGQMGNSEVGHTNIGAGRVVYQELTRITKAFQEGEAAHNPALCAAVENCKKNDAALHLMGLLSDGGVHSHQEHLYGLLRMAKDAVFRPGLHPGAGGEAARNRRRQDRHRYGPLLCHGPRQPLGPRVQGL